MTNADDKAAARPRTTVRRDGPYPAMVMAHGIGAIKAGGLAPFAERFCRASFVAVVFDYRESCRSSGKGQAMHRRG